MEWFYFKGTTQQAERSYLMPIQLIRGRDPKSTSVGMEAKLNP